MPERCPVCGTTVFHANMMPDRPLYNCECARCGRYGITSTLTSVLKARTLSSKVAAVASHAIRKMQAPGSPPVLDTAVWERLVDRPILPSPAVQTENLILELGDVVEGPGKNVIIGQEDQTKWVAIVGALDGEALRFIIDGAVEERLIKSTPIIRAFSLTLSFTGWQEYERLKKGKSTSKKAFMAMAYANESLNIIFRDQFKPAAREAGFRLARLDEQPKAGLIDNHLRVEIRSSRFLVVDLSDENPGAYWEAGYAEGLGKPVIYTCARSMWQERGTHFDTSHSHTILWDLATPLQAKRDLVATIRATLPEDARMPEDDAIGD